MKKTGYVYLMKNNRNGYTKIGFTKNEPSFREKTLASEDPDIELIHSTYGLTMGHEKKLHDMFSEKRLRGEWFDLGEGDINKIKLHLDGFWLDNEKRREHPCNDINIKNEGTTEKEDWMMKKTLHYVFSQEAISMGLVGDKVVVLFDVESSFTSSVLRMVDAKLCTQICIYEDYKFDEEF